MSFKGQKNVYLCECGHGFVTIDRDAGVTPFLAICRRPGCGGQAASLCYKIPQSILAKVSPVLEWYRPNEAELAKVIEETRKGVLAKSGDAGAANAVAAGMGDHVKRGGLLCRPVADREKHPGDCGACWQQMERGA